MIKKKQEYFTATVEADCLVLRMKLEAPSADNRSKGSEVELAGKMTKLRDGDNYVIGRAFGKLPFAINGKIVKVNAYVTVPVDDAKSTKVTEITFRTPPPVIAPGTPAQA